MSKIGDIAKTFAQRPDVFMLAVAGAFSPWAKRRAIMLANEEISKTSMHMIVPKTEWERAERICQAVAAETLRAYEESEYPMPDDTPLRLAYQWLARSYLENGALPEVDGC